MLDVSVVNIVAEAIISGAAVGLIKGFSEGVGEHTSSRHTMPSSYTLGGAQTLKTASLQSKRIQVNKYTMVTSAKHFWILMFLQ